MTNYLLDTNAFIEAKNRCYGFDFCPAFWDWLIEQNHAGKVASIEKVTKELYEGKDTLAEWAKTGGDNFFLTLDNAVVSELRTVSDRVSVNGYQPGTAATFLQAADCWLVAHALAHNCTVVTHEVRADTIRKIKIPNVCENLDIRCVNPFEMLRREQARFVLGPGREVA